VNIGFNEVTILIIDTHTHFYDPTRPQGVPWPNPEDAFLYRKIMPEDFRREAASDRVVGTVVVEASAWMEDNQWILDLASKDPFLLGLVGHLEPQNEGFETALERFAVDPLFLGMRSGQAPTNSPDHDRAWEQLVSLNLTLDLLVGVDCLSNVGRLASRFPNLRIVLNHLGHVPITGGQPDPEWVSGIEHVAKYENVYCKISGMVELAQPKPVPLSPHFYQPIHDVLWKALGEHRLLYASNWPVSWRFATYSQVQQLAIDCFKSKGTAALDKIMGLNSKDAYRWVQRRG